MLFAKKGITLNNLLGIILALLGLIIFSAGLYKLYTVTVNQESEDAKAVLNGLVSKIAALEEGVSTTFTLRGVKGWDLVVWNREELSAPEKCSVDNCICICPATSEDGLSLSNSCQQNGFCQVTNERTVFLTQYGFGGPLYGQGSTNTYHITHGVYYLPDNLFEIGVFKNSGLINFTLYDLRYQQDLAAIQASGEEVLLVEIDGRTRETLREERIILS